MVMRRTKTSRAMATRYETGRPWLRDQLDSGEASSGGGEGEESGMSIRAERLGAFWGEE